MDRWSQVFHCKTDITLISDFDEFLIREPLQSLSHCEYITFPVHLLLRDVPI